MEPADIDWKNLEWRFVKDDLFEHFNAPKWADLSSPSPRGGSPSSVPSDEAWFCRPGTSSEPASHPFFFLERDWFCLVILSIWPPSSFFLDCRHPKTVEDFLRSRSSPPTCPSKVKLARTWSSPLGERNQNSSNSGARRDANLKRRGGAVPPTRDSPRSKLPAVKKEIREDLENQDPNLSPTTPCRAAKIAKETVKSSAERREPPLMPERPLKSTLSARNLFAGKDILSQISEFCNEIKRLAMPKSESSRGVGCEDKNRKAKEDLNALEEKGKKPLMASGEDAENTKKTKQGRDAGRKEALENLRVPPEPKKKARVNSPLLKDLENLNIPPKPKKKARENSPLLQVRSCPPTPQRFPSPKTLRRIPTTTPVKSSLKPAAPVGPTLLLIAASIIF
ncbi:hypothetical protein Taro_040264, partial [Colocasia esculenta]|nr:hypothetical protein [Colocasia esculenta]